jgi:hypothetical protein
LSLLFVGVRFAHPNLCAGDAGIGILKGLGNLPSDIANLFVMAGKQSPPGQLMEDMARAMDAQALAAFDAADVAKANALAKFAANVRNSGYVDDIFELKGNAQKGGSVLSMFVPFGGAVKAVRVVRATTATKAATTATRAATTATKTATKGIDTAADIVKGADTAAAKGVDAGAGAAKTAEKGAKAKAAEAEGIVDKPNRVVVKNG